MRQLLSEKKVKKLREQTGLPIAKVMVSGGDHSKDLCLEDGSIVTLYSDGSLIKYPYPWKINK